MKLKSALVISILSISNCSLALAARNFTPQSGTWVVKNEIDGNPGRGISIDVQENTFFMQIYNYRKDGSATFHTALGEINGNTVETALIEYENGRYFGSEEKIANEHKIIGNVLIEFKDGISASIQLPNEEKKDIVRYLISKNNLTKNEIRKAIVFQLDSENNPENVYMTDLQIIENNSFKLNLTSPYTKKIDDPGEFLCHTDDYIKYSCQKQEISSETIELTIAGPNISGVYDNGLKNNKIIGHLLFDTSNDGSSQFCQQNNQTYTSDKSLCQSLNVIPSNGTWIIDEELNGLPGRGIGLDIQESTAILQIFNYKEDGRSTFHMGFSEYKNSAANVPTKEYYGGRYYGGKPQSAYEINDYGLTQFSMLNSSKLYKNSILHGFIKFPNEDIKKIQRLIFNKPESQINALLGTWYMAMAELQEPSTNSTNQFFSLNFIENGKAISNNRRYQCTTQSEPDYYYCEHFASDLKTVTHKSIFSYDGFSNNIQNVKIKDKFGNLIGF